MPRHRPSQRWCRRNPFQIKQINQASESRRETSSLAAAHAQGFNVGPGARGFGVNADFRSVVTFLNIGTSIGHLLR